MRELVDLVDGHAAFECIADVPYALVAGRGELDADVVARRFFAGAPAVLAVAAEAEAADFQPAQRLLKRFLERAADGHRLADALHLRGEHGVGFGEFLEGKPRDLGHHIVDRRLEAGHRLAGDVVGQFVQPIADGQLGRDLGDGKARGLAGQRARAADAGVHFDDDHPAGFRMRGELDVRAAGFHADFANHGQRGVAHPLVFLVGQRLRRGHGDRVARVHAHRIEVFDRADDHDVVVGVAHHLHLVLFPADDRFFDQHFADGRGFEPAGDQLVELAAVVGDGRAAAAHREAGANHARQTDVGQQLAGLGQRCARCAPLHTSRPIFSIAALNSLRFSAFSITSGRAPIISTPYLCQHAVRGQFHGQVQGRSARPASATARRAARPR